MKALPSILCAIAFTLSGLAGVVFGREANPAGGALAGERPRVLISSDIGGGDPDDFQSMVHVLLYADVLDIEGLIASPPMGGRKGDISEVIDAYENDYVNLRSHRPHFPPPDALRAITKQGAERSAPNPGWTKPTEGSRWIIKRAEAEDQRPLWILVWGGLSDIAQAVHDAPHIKSSIRVYSIGSWNTRNDQASRDYLYRAHKDLWWIESNTTFRGMYMGGRQDESWGNGSFVDRHVRNHGALGELFYRKKRDIKMGDSPSVLYLLRGPAAFPAKPHWGGSFQADSQREHYWTDRSDRELIENGRAGARTVNRWRVNYLRDWRLRMDWASKKKTPSDDTANP